MKIIELLIEVYSWIRIVLSPLLVGIFLGIVFYLLIPSTLGLMVGISFILIGFGIGILWATRVWKKYGTTNYIARTQASPDLNNLEEKSN